MTDIVGVIMIRRSRTPWPLAALFLLPLIGCGEKRLTVVPVEGKVLHQGKSLEFGCVMFQPQHGPPATGIIQPDGTFHLSTYAPGDGAVLGSHTIRITCYESQKSKESRPPGDEEDRPPVHSYIPEKYTLYATSGLNAEIKESNQPFVFELD
jgi:hypothetical protein